MPEEGKPLEIGKGRILKEGHKIALLSYGTRLSECLKASEELAALGLSTTVADARFAKPLDTDLVLRLAREHEVLVTIEEGAIGGFGGYVMQALAEAGALDRGLKVRSMVLPDIFIDQDSPNAMYAKAGLDAKGSVAKVTNGLNFSYPGYNETFCGFPDPRMDSNDKRANPNVTVLEWLHRMPSFRGRIAAFTSWGANAATKQKTFHWCKNQ